MRPLVALRYRAENAWSRPAPAATEEPPQLENSGPVDAYDVSVSPLVVDDQRRCAFEHVSTLRQRETVTLKTCITPPAPSLGAVISRRVVDDVLAGRPPVTHWPVKVSYRDDEGRSYATWCEIRVVRLPLEIEAAVIPAPEPEATSAREAAPSQELLVGVRR